MTPRRHDFRLSTRGEPEGARPFGSGNLSSASLGGIVGVTGVGAAYGTGADDAGTVSEASGLVGLGFNRATVTFTTKALTLARGLFAPNPTATGGLVLGTYIGLDIEALTRATTNIGIRNASRYVATPPAATDITAVTATVPSNAEAVKLTANASYVLTSTPSITAGQLDGQRLYVMNQDTVDTITLQDVTALAGSTVRGKAGANVVLLPRSVTQFMWSSVNAEWMEV